MRVAMAFLLLCACQQKVDHSRDRVLLMITNHAPIDDICREARDNARRALYALDKDEYRYWLEAEKSACPAAKII
jgi:hypothetical protein